MVSKILVIEPSTTPADEKKRQEDFCESILPGVMAHADKFGMGKVASYLLGMAVGLCGEAGADEFEILEAVINGINARRCIICGQFEVHLHGKKQYP